MKRHPEKWRLNLGPEHIFPELRQHPLEQCVDILTRHKRRLDVHLGELHLAVRPQVLVAETARDLEVLLHPGHHQDLLKLLGRLRQRVKLTGMDARRHEIFARALRRAFEQRRSLDLDELLGIEIIADRLGRLVAHLEVLPHFRPAQIKIPIGQAQIFVHLVAADVIERERRRVGDIVNRQLGGLDLNPTGGQRRVDGAFRAGDYLAGNTDHGLRLEMRRLLADGRVGLRVEHHLRDAFAVAQVDKEDAAVVAD